MIKLIIGIVLAAVMTGGAASSPSPSPRANSLSSSLPVPQIRKPLQPAVGNPPLARLPGFAAWLADQPIVAGSAAWAAIPDTIAWHAIAGASSDQRQAARWAYAESLIATARGPDAIGVLEVMIADDPDLALVAAWQRARGVAQVQALHLVDGLASLRQPGLSGDPEACLWRMRALADQGDAPAAFSEFNCALPALNARGAIARRPFVLAAARAATGTGRHDIALTWLAPLPDADSAANLLRGKADLALNYAQDGRLRLARVDLAGNPEERADAVLTTIEHGLASGTMPLATALTRLDVLLLGWRGDAIERRALALSMRLGGENQDATRELKSGATLSRYFDLGAAAGPLVATLQARLKVLVAADSGLPLARAVGLFWDYRDFAPSGIDGLRLAELLVARLQAAGLYDRAADLLDHRLTVAATRDIEQGPLSIRIAELRILGGDPAAAIRTLRSTDDVVYPADMIASRRRLEAVGLTLLGKSNEALAVLDDVPDGVAISAEIYWRARDWAHLEATGAMLLPSPGRLNEVGQAIVLRQTITSAMLGHREALARLHQRYANAFAGLPAAAAFEMLAGNPDKVDPAALARAMGAMPTASPIGAIGDMIEAGQAAMASRDEIVPPG